MMGERGQEFRKIESPCSGSCDELLENMRVWADRLVPPDLVFDVTMRRRVLAQVPAIVAREGRRRVVRALRVAAVAAAILVMLGGVVVDLRAQVPPVVEDPGGQGGLVLTARAPVPSVRDEAVAGRAGLAPAPEGKDQASYYAKTAPARVRLLRVLGTPAAAQAPSALAKEDGNTVWARGTAEPAGLTAVPEMEEVRFSEPLTYAGEVSGQAVVVTATGRVWRYVGGSLVGGENLLPAAGRAGSLILLPGKETPVALWVDSQGGLRLNGDPAALSLPAQVHRLSPVPGGGTVTTLLAAGALRQRGGYEVQVWLLAWQQGSLSFEGVGGRPYLAPEDPDVLDLAACRGDRGLTVYLAVRAGQQEVSYLGEGRDGQLRWRRLPAPIFRPGTAVASASGTLAGVHPEGNDVAVVEWTPSRGMAAWFRPGVYRVRRLSFPELGDPLRSVYFFDPEDTGQEGLLLVGQSGTVGYVDPALVSRR